MFVARRTAALLLLLAATAACSSLRVESLDPERPAGTDRADPTWREAGLELTAGLSGPASPPGVVLFLANELPVELHVTVLAADGATGQVLGERRLGAEYPAEAPATQEPVRPATVRSAELRSGDVLVLAPGRVTYPDGSRPPAPAPSIDVARSRTRISLAPPGDVVRAGDTVACDIVVESPESRSVVPVRLVVVRHDETLERVGGTILAIPLIPFALVFLPIKFLLAGNC